MAVTGRVLAVTYRTGDIITLANKSYVILDVWHDPTYRCIKAKLRDVTFSEMGMCRVMKLALLAGNTEFTDANA
jgi:hypothetical protein